MNKIVTLCGSMKFQHQMMALALKLELEEKCVVIQCVYSDDKTQLSPHDVQTISQLHYQKIDISDAIYVVNVGGYIGESTKKEITYTSSLNKEIIFLEPVSNF